MNKKTRPVVSAILSAVYMGLGQLFNRQYIKGLLYMIFYTLLLLFGLPYIYWGIEGLVTLGSIPKQDHSLFLMVYGVLSILALTVVLYLYFSCIADAYKKTKQRNEGKELSGFKDSFKDLLKRKAPLFFAGPGILAVVLIVVLPLLFSIMLAFTNYDLYHQPPGKLLNWVGLKNFIDIISTKSWSHTFFSILLWTIVFTLLTSILPYAVGIFLAVLLNSPKVRFKKLFRLGFILPWAIPSYISILVWKGMFDTNDGFINNVLLKALGLNSVPWMQSVTAARVALVIVAIWCGFTFPMMISDSIMKSIPRELYEAARLDGATSRVCFAKITLPLLMFSISPLFIMGIAGAFNNFNLIYLFSAGAPPNLDFVGAGSTDILISWLFNLTFDTLKYNYASAISLVIFIFLAVFSIINLRRTKSFSEEEMLQ